MSEATSTDPGVARLPPRYSVTAVITLIVGIVSLPGSVCCWLFALPLSVSGVALGIVSLVQFKNAPRGELRGREFALIGLVLSSVSLLVILALLVFGIAGQIARPEGY